MYNANCIHFVLCREPRQEPECDVDITGIEIAEVGSEVTMSNNPLTDELIKKLQEPFSDVAVHIFRQNRD